MIKRFCVVLSQYNFKFDDRMSINVLVKISTNHLFLSLAINMHMDNNGDVLDFY